MKQLHRFHAWFALATAGFCSTALGAGWSITEGPNNGGPGQQALVSAQGKPVARLVHGQGQFKPYLHVYGEEGQLLTNAGLDAAGKPAGKFPHHRGIFIGWNKITSDLGSFDLWHFNNGGQMELSRFELLKATDSDATLVALITWRGGKKDADGSDLLLNERRTLKISRPEGRRTQIDARFELTAARDLKLDGDLQHAGIHFRAADEVATHNLETVYVSDPEDKETKSRNWKPGPPKKDKEGKEIASPKFAIGNLNWCRLIFPIGERWYAASELNAPSNPIEELSWRDYGRFGFFFKKSLKKGERLAVDYRFFVEPAEAPAEKGTLSAGQSTKARSQAAADFTAFAKSFRR
jgi:hypothetical protein